VTAAELEVGAARLGWEVTGEPGDDGRWPVEKDGQAGHLTLFPLDGAKDDPNAARAARCAAWARVTHEALVKPDVGVEGDALCVVVPDLPRPGEEPHPPQVALAICASVAGALHALHQAGVHHGELDVWCVVRRDDGAACLLPPGLRPAPVGLERLGLACDPRYAAAEVLDGRPPTVRSDVASLGFLLVRLLTGKAPCSADGQGDLPAGDGAAGDQALTSFLSRLAEPLPDAPGAPAPVAALVHQLCDRDPSRRPPTALDAQQALLAASAGRSPAARGRSVKPVPRQGLAGPLVLLVVAALAAWGLWRFLEQRRPIVDPFAGFELRRPQ
jgi:hypothetical protein